MIHYVVLLTALFSAVFADNCFDYEKFKNKLGAAVDSCDKFDGSKYTDVKVCYKDIRACIMEKLGISTGKDLDTSKTAELFSQYAKDDVKKTITADLATCANKQKNATLVFDLQLYLRCAQNVYEHKCSDFKGFVDGYVAYSDGKTIVCNHQ